MRKVAIRCRCPESGGKSEAYFDPYYRDPHAFKTKRDDRRIIPIRTRAISVGR